MREKLVYIVEISIYKFVFEDSELAVEFLEAAAKHNADNASVSMTVKKVEEGKHE